MVKTLPLSVVLDTNFLTVPAQFGVDVFSEAERVLEQSIEFILLRSVLEEIQAKLTRSRKTEKRMFTVALDLTNRCKIVDVDQSMRDLLVDDQLLEYVQTVHGVLATNDRELRERAAERKIPVLMLRGKNHLELRGSIF